MEMLAFIHFKSGCAESTCMFLLLNHSRCSRCRC